MRAVIFYAPRQIRLTEVPVPRPQPGQILIKIGSALTCGTDFKAYRQGHPLLLGDLPAPFGHELAGTVLGVGEGVSGFKEGDRVVAANSAPCDECFYCHRHQNQLCENLKLHNGAYAEYNLIPAQIVKHNLYRLPDGVDFAHAALSEPLACAIHAVDALRVREGEAAAVIGAGTMALLIIQALKARRAKALVVGRDQGRLNTALAAGADHAFSLEKGNPWREMRALTGGRGPDCVFEAVGKAETWQMAVDGVRRGGRVCLFGGCAQGTRVPLDAHRIHYGEISLHGVFHHTPLYFAQALDLISTRKVNAEALIQGRIALDEVPHFFETKHAASSPKVAVIP